MNNQDKEEMVVKTQITVVETQITAWGRLGEGIVFYRK